MLLDDLARAEQQLHNLKMRWPCGIRSIDDEADRKRKALAQYIQELKAKIGA